jgi:hypothetical protein
MIMVRFICPADPKKATHGYCLKSALRIFSNFSHWKMIEERHEFIRENKLKEEKA